MLFSFRLLTVAALLLTATSKAQVSISVVAQSDHRSTTPTAFSRFARPVAASAGVVGFRADYRSGDDGWPAIFVGQTQIVRGSGQRSSGDLAPGSKGRFAFFGDPFVNAAGQIAFRATADDIPHGFWGGSAGQLQLIAANGSSAPGTNGGTFALGNDIDAFNDRGQVAFRASVDGAPEGTQNGIWMGVPGALTLVAREGEQAVGLAAGVSYQSLRSSTPLLNSAGQIAFIGSFNGPALAGGSPMALWVGAPGALQVVAQTGDLAPGLEGGATLQIPATSFGLNAAGQVAFIAEAQFSASSIQALYAGGPGSLRLVARRKAEAPGMEAGTTWDAFNAPVINAAGEVLFSASLRSGGATGSSQSIWTGKPGQLRLVARVGDEAPGTGGGRFIAFDSSAMLLSDSGQVAFLAIFDGPNGSGGGQSLFATDKAGVLHLVARYGESVAGSPPVFDLLLYPGSGGGQPTTANGDGRRCSCDRNGNLVFKASWSEPGGNFFGQEAVFKATFPETAPVIPKEGEPANVRAVLGGSATFEVTARGSRPANFQWRRNGADIPGATTPQLTLTNLTEESRGAYTVVVNNALGTVESAPAQLSFAPVITAQPQSRSVGATLPVAFSVTASGTGTLSYFWEFQAAGSNNFTEVTGATGPALTFNNVVPSQAGRYRVVVSNADGITISSEAVLTVAAAGAAVIDKLILRGEPAPAFGPDMFFGGGNDVVINNAGDVAFESGLVDANGRILGFAGVFGGRPGDYGLFFRDANDPNLGDSNKAVMQSSLLSGSSDSNNGILHGPIGDVQILSREAQPAPGTNRTFRGDGFPSINASGTAAFVDSFAGLFIGEPGALQSIAQIGGPAPGAGSGATFTGIGGGGGLAFNDNGAAAFVANVQGTRISENNDEGIWIGTTSSVQLAVREGSTAPGAGAGAVFGSFLTGPNINNAGEIAFISELAGTASGEAIHATGRGQTAALRLVARVGATYDGHEVVDLHGSLITAPLINAAGQVAFGAFVQPAGANENRQSIWRWTPGDNGGTRKLIVRAGQQAPGCPAGVVFGNGEFAHPFFRFSMNAAGQIAFKAFVTGPGVSSANRNHEGLWLTTPSGEVKLVARIGDPFDIGGGVMKTLETVFLPIFTSGGQDGQPRVLNDAGEFVFTALFDSFNTNGLFRASLPGTGGGGGGGNAPVAAAVAPSDVTATAATLKGTVDRRGLATSVHFEYGTTTSYGQSTPIQQLPAGAVVPVSASINGLAPDTLYHFRVVATNTAGTASSADATFTTSSGATAPFKITITGAKAGDIVLPNKGLDLEVKIEPASAEKKIASVQFFVDGVAKGKRDTKPDFGVRLRDDPDTAVNEGLDPGERIITAVAVDKTGREIHSAPVEVIAEAAGGGPLALRVTSGAPTVAPGGLITYTLSLVNTTRKEVAEGVRLDLVAPSRTSIINAGLEGAGSFLVSPDGDRITYALGKIGPQGSRRLTVFVRVPFDYPANEGDVDIHTFKVSGKSQDRKFTGEFPFLQVSVSGPPVGDTPYLTFSKSIVDRPDSADDGVDFVVDRERGRVHAVEPGDLVSIQLTAFNGGNGKAERVIALDRLPPGVSLIRSSVRVNGQPATDKLKMSDSRNLYFHLGDIAAGARVTIGYQMRINVDGKGAADTNEVLKSLGARVSTASLDSAVRSSPFELPIKVVAPVSLVVAARAFPPQSIAGQATTYYLDYVNEGGKTATDVVIEANVPFGTALKRIEGIEGTKVSQGNGKVSFRIGTVPGESTGQVRMVVDVTQTALTPAADSITDLTARIGTASRQSRRGASQPPNTATLERNRVRDLGRANVCLTRTAPQRVKVGETFHHTIVVANLTGAAFAADVLLSFNVPAGAEFVSSKASRQGGVSAPGTATVQNGRFTQFLNGLPGGEVIGIDVTFRATGAADTDIVDNTLYVAPFEDPEEVTFAPVIAGLISTRIVPKDTIGFLIEDPVGAYFGYNGGNTSEALADPQFAAAVARRVSEGATITTVAGADFVQLLSGAVLIPMLDEGRVLAVGPDNIVAAGGGNIVAAGAGNFIAATGKGANIEFHNLVGPDGASLNNTTGREILEGIVAAGAGNIVAAGAGNIVAAGAGNLIGPDGASLIGPDGASFSLVPLINQIVAAGAGNIVAAGAGNIVAAGAGNLIGIGGAGLIGPDGGTLTSFDVSKAFTMGLNGSFFAGHGGNLLETANAPIVAAGAGN